MITLVVQRLRREKKKPRKQLLVECQPSTIVTIDPTLTEGGSEREGGGGGGRKARREKERERGGGGVKERGRKGEREREM